MSHKLLLADDSVTIQRVIELTFADEDVQVSAVGDGEQAIAHVQADRPDIVLADIGMPKRSGYDVAAFIKKDAALSHIPVLLLTGAFEPVDEERVRQAGCEGVLVKPFEPQQVIARVRELLHKPAEGPAQARSGRSPAPSPPPPPAAGDRSSGSQKVIAPAPRAIGPQTADLSAPRPAESDDYFDRLDAAFTARAAVAEPAPERPASRPAGAEPAASPIPAVTSIADAFSALLAAEQGDPGALPVRLTVGQTPVINDELIEKIVKRVVEQLGSSTVRSVVADVVSEVAERLVREEIERIRNKTSS